MAVRYFPTILQRYLRVANRTSDNKTNSGEDFFLELMTVLGEHLSRV